MKDSGSIYLELLETNISFAVEEGIWKMEELKYIFLRIPFCGGTYNLKQYYTCKTSYFCFLECLLESYCFYKWTFFCDACFDCWKRKNLIPCNSL